MTTIKLSNVAAIAALIVVATTVGWGLRQASSQTASGDPVSTGDDAGLPLEQQNVAASGSGRDDAAFSTDEPAQGIAVVTTEEAVAVADEPESGASATQGSIVPERFQAFDAASQTEHEIAIRRALASPVQLEYIDMPLSEVRDDLSRRFDMHVQLDTSALSDASVDTSTLVTAGYRGMSLRTALRLMLENLELVYVVEDEFLLITTPDEADSRMKTRVYPVRPAWTFPLKDLIATITTTVEPDSWDVAGGPGTVQPLGASMVVMQTTEVHEMITDLLTQIDRAGQRPPQANGRNGSRGSSDDANASSFGSAGGGDGRRTGGIYEEGSGTTAGGSGFGYGIGGGARPRGGTSSGSVPTDGRANERGSSSRSDESNSRGESSSAGGSAQDAG